MTFSFVTVKGIYARTNIFKSHNPLKKNDNVVELVGGGSVINKAMANRAVDCLIMTANASFILDLNKANVCFY